MKKLLLFLFVVLTGCARAIPIETGPQIEVLFCERENCTTRLAGLLAGAEDAKCALYDVSVPEIKTALKRHEWITEDDKPPLMHNKFCVLDDKAVWTGSWNPTRTTKANNAVFIQSTTLAENYLDEFAELPGGYRRVRHPKISYNNNLIENYFCPEDDCKEHVLEQLESAQREIVFMIASFTDEDIMRLLRDKRQDMPVKGIIDKAQKDARKALPFASTGNIHHKVFIIDGNTVITGSYNPTKNGNERNDENILIIHDFSVAKKFLDEYDYLITR